MIRLPCVLSRSSKCVPIIVHSRHNRSQRGGKCACNRGRSRSSHRATMSAIRPSASVKAPLASIAKTRVTRVSRPSGSNVQSDRERYAVPSDARTRRRESTDSTSDSVTSAWNCCHRTDSRYTAEVWRGAPDTNSTSTISSRHKTSLLRSARNHQMAWGVCVMRCVSTLDCIPGPLRRGRLCGLPVSRRQPSLRPPASRSAGHRTCRTAQRRDRSSPAPRSRARAHGAGPPGRASTRQRCLTPRCRRQPGRRPRDNGGRSPRREAPGRRRIASCSSRA